MNKEFLVVIGSTAHDDSVETLNAEVEKGFMRTAIDHELVDAKM
jgi:hypothetical protein